MFEIILSERPTAGRIAGNGVEGGWGTGGGKFPAPIAEYEGKFELLTVGSPARPPPKGIGPADVELVPRGHTSAEADAVGKPDIVLFLHSTPTESRDK